MKLETRLRADFGILHLVPGFDLFALMLMFLALGPSLVMRSGIAIEPSPSRFQLERYDTLAVVTVGPDPSPTQFHLGREVVTLAELGDRLAQLAEEVTPSRKMILVRTDPLTPVSVEREVCEMILAQGFRLGVLGGNSGRAAESDESPGEG